MIDLHCHSTVSDGALPPPEVVQMAYDNGCRLLAISDHDHLAAFAAAQPAAAACGLQLLCAAEISTTWRNRNVHIVGLQLDPDCAVLQKLLAANRAGRPARLRAITERLCSLGLPNIYHDAIALAASPDIVGRAHLAQALVDRGIVKNKQQAFKKYLGDRAPAALAHRWASLPDAISAIRAAGGTAILAHPMRYPYSRTLKTDLIKDFIACGGRGIEIHSGRGFAKDRTNYAQVAAESGLLASIGSDFHRLNDHTSGRLGAPYPDPLSIERPVWEGWL